MHKALSDQFCQPVCVSVCKNSEKYLVVFRSQLDSSYIRTYAYLAEANTVHNDSNS